jgi:hypothetical protein
MDVVDKPAIIKTDPIYFDYNLWYIRKIQNHLNKVVAFDEKISKK